MPRPISYATPLAPKDGPKAVIVFGKNAAWTQTAAEAVRKAIQEWSGVTLELADDRTVTSEETWLVADAYRRVPMIVLGNAQDNRVMHALGTRYLLQSNRTWPGGDRFIVRTVFEPFAADVNYIVLEASNQAGMDAAAAKFGDMLKTFPKAPPTIPQTRVVAGGKDKWQVVPSYWKVPPDLAGKGDLSVSKLASLYKDAPILAGWGAVRSSKYEGFPGELFTYMLGGRQGYVGEPISTPQIAPATLKAMAAMSLLGIRVVGGRTHPPWDHYGASTFICGLRGLFQTGVLSEKEFNEFESAMAHSGANPDHYFYDHIDNADLLIGGPWGGRHCEACQFLTLLTRDYVIGHCRMDDRTRKEILRRQDGAHKTTALWERSFRNDMETSCLGEDTMLAFYCMIHEGIMENVRNGSLRRGADMYLMTTDNIPTGWGLGSYVGLGGFADGPGGMIQGWLGGSLVAAAAFYYEDPQYRWFLQKYRLPMGSEGAHHYPMHSPTDQAGEIAEPARYYGVHALPYDERMYDTLKNPVKWARGDPGVRLPPESYEKAADRVTFRDGFGPDDPFLFLASSQEIARMYPAQSNSIARMTDLGDVWLYHNTTGSTNWSRNVVSVSNGKEYLQRAACTIEAIGNLGEISAVASRDAGVAGADWTRTVVHWKGHYFAVLDRMEARQDDQFAFVCRWRTPHPARLGDAVASPASLENGPWSATAPSGNRLRIQNAESVFQTAECWEIDGSGRPYVLQQYKQARLAKGEARTFQNLLFVSGQKRPDEFEARSVTDEAMLVKGRTAAGDHLALIGISSTQIPPGAEFPLSDLQTDAAIYHLTGNLMHLMGVTTIRANLDGGQREVFWCGRPVNMLLDCRTGKAQIEFPTDRPVQAKIGKTWGLQKGLQKDLAVADAGALPNLPDLLEALWARTPASWTQPPHDSATAGPLMDVIAGSDAMEQPLRKITRVEVNSTPTATPWGHCRIYNTTNDNAEIVLTFPEPTAVSCLRLVSIDKASDSGFGSAAKAYEEGDFTFALVLSDDGFKSDLRRIDKPAVTWEEEPILSVGHCILTRLPVWRIEVAGKARQIKLLPRAHAQGAAAKARADLYLRDLQVYGPQRVAELGVHVYAADIDGDGANELVIGTSQKELAAYDSRGKRLWCDRLKGDILQLGVADLDEGGKSEVLAYLATEELHRVGGDGKEWPPADLHKFQLGAFGKYGMSGVTAMAAWAPDGPRKKEVLLWAEPCYRVSADGSIKLVKLPMPQGVGRLVHMVPGEPEVLVTFRASGAILWSSRRDADGNYIRLGLQPMVGSDEDERAGFNWFRQVDLPGFKGFLAAIEGGMNYIPIAAYAKDGKEKGWGLDTGGVPIVAALAEDFSQAAPGAPQVFVGRLDGFVNVLRLSDGASMCLLSVGEPILGMCRLTAKDGKPILAVGTKFALHLFAGDPTSGGLKETGSQKLATTAAAFAGPGGKNDRVYFVDSAGNVTVLAVRP